MKVNLYTGNLSKDFTKAALTENEWGALRNLAVLCPLTYGNAVYEARSVLSAWKREWYRNDCEGYYMSLEKSDNPIRNQIQGYYALKTSTQDSANQWIYPNPSVGDFILSLPNYIAGESIRIDILSTDGHILFSKSISNPTFSVHLPNGLYIAVVHRGKSVHTEKIVIIHEYVCSNYFCSSEYSHEHWLYSESCS